MLLNTVYFIIVDNTPPVVTCPRDTYTTIECNTEGTTVTWQECVASDNSGRVSLVSRSHAQGEFFPTGTSTVTYTFADPSGNRASASFSVVITEGMWELRV